MCPLCFSVIFAVLGFLCHRCSPLYEAKWLFFAFSKRELGTPVFKQGERSDLNNYRPISVIPVVAKVFERIIYDQLYDYFTVHKLISSHQSGFRPLHSTVTALLEATDSWAYNIDQGNVNAVVFLDLKKAFDTVDHEILCLNWINMV